MSWVGIEDKTFVSHKLVKCAGTPNYITTRLRRGDAGINRLDRIARQHDIDYASARI